MSERTLASVLLTAVLALALASGSVAAVDSTPEELPDDGEVGTAFEASFELTDLFDEFEYWTLRGETNLTDVTWTVQQYDQAGNQIRQASYDGATFAEQVDLAENAHRVEVDVTGTVPEIENFSYDPPERFLAAAFTLDREGGTEREIAAYEVHHYTEDSKAAREALDDAGGVVGDAGSNDAGSTFQDAVRFYENGDFESAIDAAERAESDATQRQTLQSALLLAGAAVVLLVVAAVGYRLYRSRQQGPSRLK